MQATALLAVLSLLTIVPQNGDSFSLPKLDEHIDGATPQQLYFYNIDRQAESPHAIENCYGPAMKQSFNDLDYALLGYNSLKGYPLTPGRDPGFTYPIFFANYSVPRYTSDCRYSLPHGIIAFPEVSCTTSFTSTVIKSQKDFSKSLSVAAQVTGGGWGVSFSANGGYKSAVSTVENGESYFIISQANCRYYFTEIDPMAPPLLDPSFIKAVSRLVGGEKEQYINFFDTYGTHFVTEMELGARYTNEHKISVASYTEMDQDSFSVGVQASYSGLFSVGGGFNLDSEQRAAASNFQKNVETSSITVGATPPASGDAMEWAASVKTNPMPMAYKLKSLEELFTEQYMANVNIDYIAIKQGIQRYKLGYCEMLKDKGTVESCLDFIQEDPCDSSPCLNDGTCFLIANGRYLCNCDDDHGGSQCEIACDLKIGTNCYWKAGDGYGNWYSSQIACNIKGGHLVEISNELENTAIANYVNGLGGSQYAWSDGKREHPDTFRWSSTNDIIPYFNWHDGEPNNAGGNENCIQVATVNDGWNDAPCETSVALALCQYP